MIQITKNERSVNNASLFLCQKGIQILPPNSAINNLVGIMPDMDNDMVAIE